MKYPIEFFEASNLLRETVFVPRLPGEGGAIFGGIFTKQHFASLREFVAFTRNISSLSQVWYQTRNINEAYEYYYPDDGNDLWIDRAASFNGNLSEWIEALGVEGFELELIPENINGQFFWYGDAEEFGVVGESEDSFFDFFIADVIYC